jgi:hypothetical protein
MISANVTEALRSSPIDVVFSWRDGWPILAHVAFDSMGLAPAVLD